MRSLTGFGPVFKRELQAYFSSPLGFIFIIIFLLASGYLTVSRDFGRFLELRQASLDPFFRFIPWIFVVLVPAVAMRLWSEERKSGTVELLLTLPVTLRGAYLGKFMAGWSFLALSLVLTAPVAIQAERLGNPDWAVILTGYLGCLLVAGAYLAVGMAFSAMTRSQVVAFILGVAGCVVFLLVGLPQTQQVVAGLLGGWVEQVVASLSVVDHFDSLTRGLLQLQTVLFFAIFTVGWLAVGMLVLDETKAS